MIGTANASASIPGFAPIVSYVFEFGDGTTVTQTTPVATHQYTVQGQYTVVVRITDAAGLLSSEGAGPGVWQVARTIALRAHGNGLYVTVHPGNLNRLIASSSSIGDAQLFQLSTNPDASTGLYSKAAGRFVTAESGGSLPLTANRTLAVQWEEFSVVEPGNAGVALRALVNSRFVTAESAGTAPLILLVPGHEGARHLSDVADEILAAG